MINRTCKNDEKTPEYQFIQITLPHSKHFFPHHNNNGLDYQFISHLFGGQAAIYVKAHHQKGTATIHVSAANLPPVAISLEIS